MLTTIRPIFSIYAKTKSYILKANKRRILPVVAIDEVRKRVISRRTAGKPTVGEIDSRVSAVSGGDYEED